MPVTVNRKSKPRNGKQPGYIWLARVTEDNGVGWDFWLDVTDHRHYILCMPDHDVERCYAVESVRGFASDNYAAALVIYDEMVANGKVPRLDNGGA